MKTNVRIDVENTPFSIIEDCETKKCNIAVGMNLMTETEFEDQQAAKIYISRQPWELILNTCALMTQHIVNSMLNDKSNDNA